MRSFLRSSVFTSVVVSLFAFSVAACGSDSESQAPPAATTGGMGGAAGASQSAGGQAGTGGGGAAAGAGTSGAAGAGPGTGGAGGGAAGSAQTGGSAGATLALGPAPVVLGAAGTFVILAKSAVSNVPTSKITGDLGLSPAAASYVTGLSLTKVGAYWTTPQVVGSVFAADNDPPTPDNLTTAVSAMMTAYTDAAGRPTPDFLNLGGGAIGGLVLAPGLYKWTSSVTIPSDVSVVGAANDTWIFQVTGDLTVAAGKSVTLAGGARAKNVVWQITGTADLGTTAHLEGIVLSQTAISLGTGASVNGRLMSQTMISLDASTVTAPTQ